MPIIDFNDRYHRETFVNFFQDEFLPDDFSPLEEEIDLDFKPQHINRVTWLGECESLGLKVYEVTHNSPHDPRVSLTKDTFRLMKQFNDFHALGLFTSPNSGNYRLSYITIGVIPDDRKIKYEYSNPRRYSYFLGPEAKINTPSRFLVKKGRILSIDDLQDRFSVEVVNKEFYRGIAALFTKLVGGKRQEGSKTSEYKPMLKLPSITDHKTMQEFAVRMIGRIVFCWFLKKKTTPNNESLVPGEILSLEAVKKYKNYYHTILEKLFFQVLNTPQEERRDEFKTGHFAGIPFLNGGLFEQHTYDFYELDPLFGTSKKNNTLIVPDEWMLELFKLLEEYNFTIDENTSMDVELSVDPEMLGRIFENLLAEINPETGETARKSTGSYYTPRPIVEYMVDESLKQYLLTKTGIKEEKLENLLSYSQDVDDLNEEEKEKIIDALDEVKIIDPACGSGAFPMGVLQKLVLILEKVDPGSGRWLDKQMEKVPYALRRQLRHSLEKENVNYIHKMGLIRNAIYGVDMQQIAVEISKLRVFLALVVDACVDDREPGNNRGIKPLPNLEFKFVCADSLVRLPQDREKLSVGLFEAHDDIKRLKDLREQYFDSYGHEKEKIKEDFKQTQERMFKQMVFFEYKAKETLALSAWEPFADKSSHWFEHDWMFGVKNGFDIVISNPPYIRQEMLKESKQYFKDHYRVYHGVADIYVYFIERGMDLLKENGVYCIIVANKWMRTNYGKPLRVFLKKKQIRKLIDFGDLPIFKATTYPCIILAVNGKPNQFFDACNVDILDLNNLSHNLENVKFKVNPSYLIDACWTLAEEKTQLLLCKLNSKGIPLTNYVDGKIYYGIKTGLNKAFVISEEKKNQLISGDPKCAELIKPFLTGRDVKRYQKLRVENYLIFTRHGVNIKEYPTIEEYLSKYKDLLTPKPKNYTGTNWKGRKPGLYKWYEIQDTIDYYQEFEKPKIVYPIIGKRPEFTIDLDGHYTNDKCFIIPIDDYYLLGVLNSSVFSYMVKLSLPKLRGDFYEFRYIYLKDILVPSLDQSKSADKEIHVWVVELVKKILTVTGQIDYLENNQKKQQVQSYISEIDRLVYQLYNLTPEEIAIVEGESE